MANTLREPSAPQTHILTDKSGLVGAEVVSSQPSVGQTGLTVYPIPSAAVTQTQDSADGTTGNTAPAVAIEIGGVSLDGKLRGLSSDTTGILRVTGASQIPVMVQKTNNLTAGGASISATLNSVKAGNTLVLLGIVGSASITLAVTDTQNNNWASAQGLQLQSMGAAIWYCPLLTSGNITVTMTAASGSPDMAVQLYEMAGIGMYDTATNSNSAAATSVTLSVNSNYSQNEFGFMVVAAKAAVSLSSPPIPQSATLDAVSTGSTFMGAISGIINAPTVSPAIAPNNANNFKAAFSSTSFIAIACIFRPAELTISGTVQIAGAASSPVGDAQTASPILAVHTLGGNPSQSAAWVQTAPFVFNGATWDRQRGNVNTTTGDAPTIVTATTTNGATQTNYNFRGAVITVILGTVSGTTPTLAAQLQYSPDGGTTWLNFSAAAAVNSIATGNTLELTVYPQSGMETLGAGGPTFKQNVANPLPRTWRLTYITTGSSLSIAISSVQVNYIL